LRRSSQPISWLSTETLNLTQQQQTCIHNKTYYNSYAALYQNSLTNFLYFTKKIRYPHNVKITAAEPIYLPTK